MRMMLRITMEVEAGNKAVKEGMIAKLVQQTSEMLKPESTYFTADHGKRTGYFFFDMKDTTQIPSIAEPWFNATNAMIDFQPVMNVEDLKTGLERVKK